MTIFVSLTSDGTDFNDILYADVESSVSEYGVSSNFSCTLPNYAGRHKTDFTIGDEIVINTGTVNPPTTKIFTGIVENIDFEGEENDEKITLSGRDYTARLMDYTVEPEVYTNTEISVIVNDIMTKYVTGVTTTNVDVTPVTLRRIAFNQVTVYEAFKRLADLAGFIFYVDVDKDLHFEAKNITPSGLTFNNTNVTSARFKQTRDGMRNRVWVYGDKALTAAPEEIFTPNGGSIFTVAKRPSNTRVSYLGSIRTGQVFNFITNDPGSAQYGVNFFDRQVIFLSGTLAGNNIPGSNVGSVVINYDALLPIVKFGIDDVSVNNFGPLTNVINDKNIKDPTTAEDRLSEIMQNDINPPVRGELSIKGIATVTPSNTVIVNLPNFNVNNVTYDIISARWEFNPSNNFSERVLNVTVNMKIQEFTDKMVKAFADLQEIQAGDISPEDLITRYIFSTGSVSMVGSYWDLTEKGIGNSHILGHPDNGQLGSTASGAAFGSSGLLVYYRMLNGSNIVSPDYNMNFSGANGPTNPFIPVIDLKLNSQINTVYAVSGHQTQTGFLLTPGSPELNLGGSAFTMAFWMKSNNVGINPRWFNKNSATTLSEWMFTPRDTGLSNFNQPAFFITGATANNVLLSGGTIVTGSWHRIVVTKDAGSIYRMYFDGNQVGGSILNITPLSGIGSICLGDSVDGGGDTRFDGFLDDVRIYKGLAWVASDVTTDYNGGSGRELITKLPNYLGDFRTGSLVVLSGGSFA